MPLPKRPTGQPLKEFIQVCMADPKMQAEFPQANQRYAVCRAQAKKK
jgi:hypothetical protein